jgi:hypothetical protein
MKRDLLAGTSTPRPPADLKQRSLRAAHAAAHDRSVAPRARWGFNRFDLAWLVALLLLVLCHVLLRLPGQPQSVVPDTSQTSAERAQLERDLGLESLPIVVAGRNAERDREEARQLIQELERL